MNTRVILEIDLSAHANDDPGSSDRRAISKVDPIPSGVRVSVIVGARTDPTLSAALALKPLAESGQLHLVASTHSAAKAWAQAIDSAGMVT